MANPKDFVSGVLFIAIGGYFLISSLFFIRIGRSDLIGPATFPTLLSLILIVIGLIVFARSFITSGSAIRIIGLRQLAIVLLAPIAFGLLVRGAGLLLALAVTIGIATLADTEASWKRRLVIIAGLTGLCIAIFSYGLRLPFPILGPWLRYILGA